MSVQAPPRPDERSRQRRTRDDRRLLQRHTETHDPRLREQLVERFLPLARRLARRYHGSGEPFDDLVQVASVGLVKAIDRFDPTRGTAFSTFAVPTIVGELKRHFRDHAWAAHVPRAMQEEALLVDRATDELQRVLGRSPSVREISRQLEISEERVLEALEARAAGHPASLDEHMSDGEGEDTRADRLGSDEEGYDLIDYTSSLRPAWQRLPGRERMLLDLRLSEGLTQTEIADRIGVSQMQVSRLLRRTLDQLREAMEAA